MKRMMWVAMLWLIAGNGWASVPLKMGNPRPKSELPVLETGGKVMPDEWVDKDTGHRIIRLTRRAGNNRSFYFNNNPFIGNEMLFAGDGDDPSVSGVRGHNRKLRQMFAVDLNSLKIRQITHEVQSVSTEIACASTHEIFFQRQDTVVAVNTDNGARRIIAVMPMKGYIGCVNCTGTLLAGTLDQPEERKILSAFPRKRDFFPRIYEAKLKKTLFVLDTKTGVMDTIFSDHAWLNHLQFSPTDPDLLMFCHEGPWQKVDRIWTLDVRKPVAPRLMHRRTMDGEIAGHEWFGAGGKYLYFDLQKPRGENFFVGRVNVQTGEEEDFGLQRSEWSVHFTTSWDERFLVGDGGGLNSVAHSPEDQWIYKFNDAGRKFRTERLVNMKYQNYDLEPNVHLTPDDRWVVFRANFEGHTDIYAVEL